MESNKFLKPQSALVIITLILISLILVQFDGAVVTHAGAGVELNPAEVGITREAKTAAASLANCRYGAVTGQDTAALIAPTGVGVMYKFADPKWSGPIPANNPEILHMIRTRQEKTAAGAYLPKWYTNVPLDQKLANLIRSNPGDLWIIGNEIERGPNPGETSSPNLRTDDIHAEIYVQAYHDVYNFIKSKDPTARIANAGLVQITPNRLQYMNKMWNAYQQKYGEPMPVDVWTIHAYVLPEVKPNGQSNDIATVALGTDPALGKKESGGNKNLCPNDGVYCVAEHDDLTILADQIVAMRQWMKAHGQQHKPLIITEYGTLYSYGTSGGICSLQDEFGKCFTPARVTTFMRGSFDYFNNAKDPQLGYGADENRLVQQAIWFSAFANNGNSGNLLVNNKTKLNTLGTNFSNLIHAEATYKNLLFAEASGKKVSKEGATYTAELTVNFLNNGNTAVDAPFAVTFYSDAARTKIIGSTTVTPVVRGCATKSYSATVNWSGLPGGTHQFWVAVDSGNAIVEKPVNDADNIGSGQVTVSGTAPTPTNTPVGNPPPTNTPVGNPPPTATPIGSGGTCSPDPNNVLANPGFESGKTSWSNHFANGVGTFSTGSPAFECSLSARINFSGSSTNMQLYQTGFSLQKNTSYVLSFAATSNSGHDLTVSLQKHVSPYTNFGVKNVKANLTGSWQTFTIPFTTGSDASNPRLLFWFVGNATAGDVYQIDDVRIVPAGSSPPPPPTATPVGNPPPTATPKGSGGTCSPDPNNVLANPGFESGKTSWSNHFANRVGTFSTGSPAFECDLSASINFSGSSTNMQLYQTGFSLQKNTSYVLSFAATSNSGHDLTVSLQKHVSPYTNFGVKNVKANLTGSWQTFTIPFTTGSDASNPRLLFWFVGNATAGDVYQIDDVRIVPAGSSPPPPPTATPVGNPPPTATPKGSGGTCSPDPNNVLANPGFESGKTSWSNHFANRVGTFSTGSPAFECDLSASINFSGSSTNMQLYQTGFSLQKNTSYVLSFAATSNSGHDLTVSLQKHVSPYTNFGVKNVKANLTGSWQTFTIPFTTGSDASNPRLLFWFVGNATAGDVYQIDDVRIVPGQ